MGRIARSFSLVGQSFRVLMRDKELMVLPLMSGILIIAVVSGVLFGFGINESRVKKLDAAEIGLMFAVMVATYAIGIFFQAAVIAGATERMRGGDPTISSALAAAARRAGSILVWAVIAATVGTVLRLIEDKAGFIGRIVVRLVGAAWALATLFVVPVLVLEDASVTESVSRSVAAFKRTWGETTVGTVNLGVAAFLAWITLIAVTGLVAWAGAGVWALALFFPGALVLAVLFSTLQGVFTASLYRYATSGDPAGFDRDLLAGAFAPKR